VARTWLSIRVDLVSGPPGDLWPRPGRIFAAARSHTFAQLGRAIDDALARWDHAHMHMFTLADGTEITDLDDWDGEEPETATDSKGTKLGRLTPRQQFAYVFDFGDNWTHLCTVAPHRIDPLEQVGIIPDRPTAYWGWGDLPDQYGRRFDGDDGESPTPKRPHDLTDLPPLLPWWGQRHH
jgi:Plasmid pRiA4b ORF-3-like protein